MMDQKLFTFALTLTAEVLRAQHPEAQYGQLNIALYKETPDQGVYCVLYDLDDEDFVLCKVLTRERAEEFGELADVLFNSELETMASFNTAEEAAGRLMELALEEDLLPQINYSFYSE